MLRVVERRWAVTATEMRRVFVNVKPVAAESYGSYFPDNARIENGRNRWIVAVWASKSIMTEVNRRRISVSGEFRDGDRCTAPEENCVSG